LTILSILLHCVVITLAISFTKPAVQWTTAGERNRQISIKHKVKTGTDDNGDPVYDYPTFAKPWAKIEINSGREFWGSRKNNAEWDGLFKIAYRSGITTDMFILYGTRTFNIQAVIDPLEAHREIWIEAKEVI